jgi:predicted O-methyltransferase YrrM
MRKIIIQEKLKEMGVYIEDIVMGDFDVIGEYTAKKNRTPDKQSYKSAGCFFRPNYERGILMYYLTRKNEFNSVLEIGFGRGYATMCMAKAMCDHGIDGKITTVDPNLNEEFLNQLVKIFPPEWFQKIEFVKLDSKSYYKENPDKKFDFVYIDGDHRYDAVKSDWEYAQRNFNKNVLFDDYIFGDRQQKDIECSRAINEIEGYNKEVIIMDRRMFFDDRGKTDDEIDYGQVLVSRIEEE